MPALMAWMSSPRLGTPTTTVVSAARAISTSSWPTPTVSTMTTSLPKASSSSTTSSVLRASPPMTPRVAMLRMKTPESLCSSIIRTRSPRMAPPVNGLVGSTATMPTDLPRARYSAASRVVRVDLPEPGGPVTPSTWARPVFGYRQRSARRASSRPASTAEIRRDSASRSPAVRRSASSSAEAVRASGLVTARRPSSRYAGTRRFQKWESLVRRSRGCPSPSVWAHPPRE